MKFKLTTVLVISLLACILTSGNAIAQTSTHNEAKQDADHRLSEAQLASIKSIRIKYAKLSAPMALHLAKTVKAVYENMLREKEDPTLRTSLSREMHNAAGELLTIRGQTIREVIHVLTPKQRQFLKSEMGKPDAPADVMELITRTFNIPEL